MEKIIHLSGKDYKAMMDNEHIIELIDYTKEGVKVTLQFGTKRKQDLIQKILGEQYMAKITKKII